MASQVYVVRHGETAWTRTGQHTSCTDVPLTATGERQARDLQPILAKIGFSHVLTSPSQRAWRTCELAGLSRGAHEVMDLREWNYGDYEGRLSADIHEERPGWNVFADGAPQGETPDDLRLRADRIAQQLERMDGIVGIFSHGQFLRALAMRWIGRPVGEGRNFVLDPASLGVLGFEHPDRAVPVIARWNCRS